MVHADVPVPSDEPTVDRGGSDQADARLVVRDVIEIVTERRDHRQRSARPPCLRDPTLVVSQGRAGDPVLVRESTGSDSRDQRGRVLGRRTGVGGRPLRALHRGPQSRPCAGIEAVTVHALEDELHHQGWVIIRCKGGELVARAHFRMGPSNAQDRRDRRSDDIERDLIGQGRGGIHPPPPKGDGNQVARGTGPGPRNRIPPRPGSADDSSAARDREQIRRPALAKTRNDRLSSPCP